MALATGIFRRPFAEQVAAFRLRLTDLRPTAAWTDLWQAEHDRAFMVAGAMKADLLADLAGAVQRAIEDGTGIEAFRRDFRSIVEARGWHGWTGEGSKRGEAWRTRVIYKTNMATSYAAGRWAQLMRAGYPLLVYRHGGSLDPRLQHLSWDGLILPVDHPFWATHAPPNGWGCSCFVTGARSERDAVRKGGKPGKRLPDGWALRNPKTGAPDGIDRGWAYAPGASVAETVAQFAGKLATLPPPIAADVAVAFPQVADAVPAPSRLNWQDWTPARTVADAVQAAKAAGIAEQVAFGRGSTLAGVNAFVRTAAEIMQRFDLPKLTAMASKRQLPFRISVDSAAAAFYVPARTALGVNPMGFSPRKVAEAFDIEDAPAEVAKWSDQLARVAQDIQSRARRMQAASAPRRWSVVRDVRGVAAHELGHHLHYSVKAELDQLVRDYRMIEDGWHLLISRYSAKNDREFVAEAFALYITGGEAEHYRLHPALLAFFKGRDKQK
jgi:hypothetical protein